MHIETPWGNNTQLYISTSGDSSDVVAALSQCLEATGTWMEDKKLQLNPNKMEWLWICQASGSQRLSFRWDGIAPDAFGVQFRGSPKLTTPG